MRKKIYEKEAAIELRRKGESVKNIAKKLGVSASSVSVWVRNIELSDEQKNTLMKRCHNGGYSAAQIALRNKYLEQRKMFQEKGRQRVKECFEKGDVNYIAGCMLYWGEGSKKRNTLQLSNSDVAMQRVFVKFLREYFDVKNGDIKVAIQCHLDHGLTLEEIENYWLSNLRLERKSLYKTRVNYVNGSSKRTLDYGTCYVVVHNTEIVQEIYGAIQEYSGCKNENWLK